MIKATLTTDDDAMQVIFDAEPYFRTLTPETLSKIVRADFSSSYATDDIARDQQGKNHQVDELFKYLDLRNSGFADPIGFNVNLDENHAIAFIHKHHPEVLEENDLDPSNYNLDTWVEGPLEPLPEAAGAKEIISDLSKVMLVYVAADGSEHAQQVGNLVNDGTLIDPDTGDDMNIKQVLILN